MMRYNTIAGVDKIDLEELKKLDDEMHEEDEDNFQE